MPFSPTPIIQSTKKTRETKQQKSIIKYTIACQLAEQRILSFGSRLPVEKELYFCCICSGRPQLGQFFKEVSTSFPQSGQIINAIIVTLDFVGRNFFLGSERVYTNEESGAVHCNPITDLGLRLSVNENKVTLN